MLAGARRARPAGRVVAGLVALLLAASGALALTVADGAPPARAATPSGSNVVAVPYAGDLPVKPALGWTFASCPDIQQRTALVVACDPSTMTVRSSGYDPDFGVLRVPVTLAGGTTQLTVDYLFRLEPPEEPSADDLDYRYPFPAGSRVLVPISDLQLTCTVCTTGATLQAVSVKPKRAGVLTVTPTHLVLTPAAGYTGDARLRVRAVDDLGQESAAIDVTVSLYAGADPGTGALHVVLPFADDPAAPTELDLAEWFSGTDARVLGCGPAAAGAVLCSGSGAATYHPPAAPVDVDQFSVHVYADGDQVTGSVTLVRGLTGVAPARGVGGSEAASTVPTRTPPPATEGATVGVFTPFARLLDGVGA